MADLWRGKPVRDNRDVERVKDASDIVRVIGEVVSLKPNGREFRCLCPFHDDHNPSMYVVPGKQIFNCFVCGAAGDVLSFVMKFHKMEFREALEYLAERAGIALTPMRAAASDQPAGPTRADLLKACAMGTEFFRGLLNHPEHGKAARAVIERRGITPAMVSQFLLGAAADRWDGLALTQRKQNLPAEPFFEAGLFKKRESDGSAYDAFRNRLIFPIQDQIGRVVAFGARRINDEDEPKYLNSPETRLFNKSATLYALNHAARSIQVERTALITEGYTDAIACHQGGFTNAVATLGTALTREHVSVLRRMCDRVVLLFDGDEAGQRAADRAAEVFFAEPLDVAICTLSRFTDAKDPDELLKRGGGAETFRRALAGASDLLDYRFARLRERLADAGMAALSKGIDEEIARLVDLGLKDVPPLRQRLIVKKLASLAGVDESVILRAIPAGRRAPGPNGGASGVTAEAELPLIQSEMLDAREWLLGCVLCDGTLWGVLGEVDRDRVAGGAYRWPVLQRVAEAVREMADDGEAPTANALAQRVEDESVRSAAFGLMSRVDVETGRGERLRGFFEQCLRTARLDQASVEVKSASTGVNPDEAALAAVRLLQESRRTLGADRRVLPRPV
ncbi:DNA primase [Phycisphaerales bacterium]|nr:DNA primase [Phycisphaerales bacterium]